MPLLRAGFGHVRVFGNLVAGQNLMAHYINIIALMIDRQIPA